jgi:hypothetical protein
MAIEAVDQRVNNMLTALHGQAMPRELLFLVLFSFSTPER